MGGGGWWGEGGGKVCWWWGRFGGHCSGGPHTWGGGNIQPKVTCADHLHGKHGGEFLERMGIVDASTPFFQGTDAALDHGDMLLSGASVQCHPEYSERTPEGFKLSVDFDDFEEETTFYIYIPNFFDVGENGVCLSVLEPCNSAELDGPADAHEKR